ncbi:LCP family protein [Frondihabitans sp. VKM Ac-2883]|uniref:LCP family protein n=1 Tax=Frondihabitans sp. VKM Ac-2883 TaxID=2783823 RepID=UPI00188B0DAC|nr:LCP family protein [Frondihabitans sp. VKM Ac-2883]MBF4575985.1 LCP family protein [Frondihabitans sp. VKM Ac-2883]
MRRARSRAKRRRQKVRQRVFIAIIIAVALIGGSVGGGVLLFHQVVGGNITALADEKVFPDEAGRPPASSTGERNILLLGSDSRQKGTEHDLEKPGSQRADTMMLVHVAADRKAVTVMSIMRDLYVPVPGHGEAKINAALAWGGTPLAVQTIEGLLGARIDHVAIIDFDGLAAMTTALGGVWVDNPQQFNAKHGADTFFAAGPIKLQGEQALTFARERYAFTTGDFQRVANQQLLLKGMLSRILSRDVLGDPAGFIDFASETSKNLSVDARFTMREMAALAYSLRDIDLGAIDFFTMPTAGTGMIGTESVVKVDEGQTAALRKALADDTTAKFAAALAKKKG